MAEETENDVVETALPATREGDGVALHGDYPLNHRLRAEALAKDGKTTDPDNMVSDELIVDAGERMKRLEAARDEAESLEGRRKAELEEIAATEGVDLSDARNNGDRVRLIEEHRETAKLAAAAGTSAEPGSSANSETGGDAGSSEEG